MAKKKAQHLYEILAQKSDVVQPPPVQEPKQVERKAPPAESDKEPPPRKRVQIEQPPVPAPVPVGRGQERVLENVVQLRRDTLIVGVLLVIVAIVVAFFIGRATAPESVSRADMLGGKIEDRSEQEKRFQPGTNMAPPPDAGEEEEATEEAAEEPAETEEQPAAQPLDEEYEIRLSSLPESMGDAKESLEKAREYLVKKGYPSAEVVKKGSHWVLRVRGYADSAAAQAAQRELAELEYQGRRDFADSQVRRMSR
jgi:hypothetical protein